MFRDYKLESVSLFPESQNKYGIINLFCGLGKTFLNIVIFLK